MAGWLGHRRVASRTLEELPPRAAYDAWAASYPPVPHTALMHAEQAAMLALLPGVAGAVVLDAACGSGRYLHALMARGARLGIGVDLSAAMLARAEPGVAGARIRGDLRALPIATAGVDVATCGLALNDVEDPRLAATELARVLRRGGRLLASALHPRGQALGWVRTFETPDGPRAVRCCWHARAAVEAAWAAAGLRVDAVLEPSIEERGDGPVALVVAATRIGT